MFDLVLRRPETSATANYILMKKIIGFLTSPRFLFFYIVLSLAVPNVALCFTEHMPVQACVANVVLPVSLYALLMTLSKKTGRQVWFLFLIVFFAAFQIVLLYLFGRGVIAVDMFLNLVTTNPGEAMELLNNLVPAVATVFILYLPLLVLAAMSWARHRTEDVVFLKRVRRYSWCGMAAGAVLIALCYAAYPKDSDFDYRAEDHVYPANIFYNLYLACRESGRVADYRKDVASFRFNARSAHDADSAEVYVLVIGETARADNFQLYGYERETNPLLSKTDGLSVFRHVLSQSNTTHKSVPMLLAAASAENHARLYREKSLITAFREAGFHTSFISNQQPNHSFIDFFGDEADDFVFIRSAVSVITGDVTAQTSDERLLPYVKNILAKKRKKELIVLHTYGSHFNYRDRYPQSRAKFLPDTPTEAEPKNRAQLINAYDNTICQTDFVLHSIITMLGKSGAQAAMLYTSDHGENIFDDYRKRFLHASPTPASHGIHVPLLVWTSASYRAEYPAVVSALNANRAKDVQSSASVFPTMLSIAGISAPCVADVMPLSLANPTYRCGARRYLNDHNRSVTLKQAGFSDIDFEQLKKWGVGL